MIRGVHTQTVASPSLIFEFRYYARIQRRIQRSRVMANKRISIARQYELLVATANCDRVV